MERLLPMNRIETWVNQILVGVGVLLAWRFACRIRIDAGSALL
jgi:hypothetical protein